MTRTQKLTKSLKSIYEAKKEIVDTLPKEGPRGGYNAKNIPGWVKIGNWVITVAAKEAGIPYMHYWGGSLPTPSTAFPECIKKEMIEEYNKIFKGEDNENAL